MNNRACCVCLSSTASDTSLFKFPSNMKIRKLWANFADLNEKNITATHLLCSRHFKTADFSFVLGSEKTLILKDDAIPSVHGCVSSSYINEGTEFLSFSDSILTPKLKAKSDERNSLTKTRVRQFICVICGVKNNELSLHRFPINEDIRSQWAAFCAIDVNQVKEWHGLCDDHFSKDDFIDNFQYTNNSTTKKLLKRNRLPSQNPPKAPEELLSEEELIVEIVDTLSEDAEILDEGIADDCYVDNRAESSVRTQPLVSEVPSSENMKRTPLICLRKFPRYFMDIKSQDVCSPKYAKLCLEMGQQTVLKYRRKIDTLQRQNKRLQNKLLSSEEVFFQLKNNSISMEEAVRTIERRNIFKFGNKGCIL